MSPVLVYWLFPVWRSEDPAVRVRVGHQVVCRVWMVQWGEYLNGSVGRVVVGRRRWVQSVMVVMVMWATTVMVDLVMVARVGRLGPLPGFDLFSGSVPRGLAAGWLGLRVF